MLMLYQLVLILIVSPFIMRAKSKKEMDTQQKMMDAINKGDTVLTSAGVIGKVVGIDANKQGYKTLTLETGDEKHKGYLCVDIRSIYYNLSNPVIENTPEKKVEETPKVEQKTEEVIEMPEDISKPVENVSVNESTEPIKEEPIADTKEPTAKHKKNKKKN